MNISPIPTDSAETAGAQENIEGVCFTAARSCEKQLKPSGGVYKTNRSNKQLKRSIRSGMLLSTFSHAL